MSDTNDTKAKLASMMKGKSDPAESQREPAPAAPADPTETPVMAETTKPIKIFRKFRHVRPSAKMLTHKGTPAIFLNYECITDNKEVIDYILAEIELGLTYVTDSGEVTSESLNPMADLKNRVIEEYLADQAKLKEDTAAAASPSATGILGTSQAHTADASNSSNS